MRFIEIEQREVCVRANRQCPFLQSQNAGGVYREKLNEAGKGNELAGDQPIQAEGNRGLETDDAECGVIELDGLFIRVVGRVIGGNRVHGAIG